MRTEIKVWHVEITDASLIPEEGPRPYQLRKMERTLPEFNRFLYLAVGAPWNWYMRLTWTHNEWVSFLSRSSVETWVAYLGATPVGYFELEKQSMGSTEICYFGLISEFIGEGLGRPFLEDAIRTAWQAGGERVWLHTCSLDHPNALPNYLARGFSIFREESIVDNIPDEPIQPWPGANKYPAR
ncbi:MAG: GNAT family N-acetyltransferase [Pseudomonadales bacterium]|nr:GNAT family N-acetyltransferase [Pseudomonadales bacterium]